MSKPPGGENLNVCEEHGVMKHSDQRKRCCPLCILDMEVEVRRGWELPEAADGDTGVKQQEIRQRIPGETLAELLPLMKEYLQDRTGEEDPELWIGVVGLDSDRDLPAGYSEAQERWINVVGYELGSRVKAVTVAGAAEETIETLRENGYGDGPELVTDGGARFGYSMMTDTWYRVTEYEDLGGGQIRAKSKEKVPREEVPQEVLDATEERGDRDA